MKQLNYEEISKTLLNIRVFEISSSLLCTYPLDTLLTLSTQKQHPQLAFRAAWIIETIFLREPLPFNAYIPKIVKAYLESENWSCLRSYTKLLMWILSPKNTSTPIDAATRKQILDKAFRNMLDEKCPIAVKVNCFDIVYYLKDDEDWIKEELHTQLNLCIRQIPTPAILSRAKRLLKKLK